MTLQNGKLNNKFVISLGGSVIAPDKININLIKKFSSFIKKETKRGNKFIIIVGGGKVSREYQQALCEISNATFEERDWIGIKATYLNSLLLKAVFKKEANPIIFDKRFKIKSFGKYSVIVGCGWRPGWSTDFVAMQIASDFGIKKVINLGKPDCVYTSDFKKDKKAKPIYRITWKDYLKIIPKKWEPGLHTPFDPIAARLARKEKMKVVVACGKNLNNFKKIIDNKNFEGTVIENYLKLRNK